MTPPPGVQQRHFLVPWRARITSRSAFAATGTTGRVEIGLVVVQIRPEDEGFVYRVRLEIPAYAPRGIYDLTVEGPGLFDVGARSVRVLPEDRETLELYVLGSGDSLWDEGEGLWLLDPDLVLAPGELLEASLPLSRWPLPTFAVPGPEGTFAHRCLDIPSDMAQAVISAADCPPESNDMARCVTAALGGVGALDICEDRYLTYLRRVGPPIYAVGLGAVTLLGLHTFDHPASEISTLTLGLGGRRVEAAATADPMRSNLGPAQRAWIRRQLDLSDELLVLGFHRTELVSDLNVSEEDFETGRPVHWVANGSEGGSTTEIEGPAIIRLHRRPRPPSWELAQLRGFEPGAYSLGEISPRDELTPAGAIQRLSPEGVIVDIRNPPAGRLTVGLLVPSTQNGWTLTASGREARLVRASPAGEDLCATGQILLEAEVSPGPSDPMRLELSPASARTSGSPRIQLHEPPRGSISVGRPAILEASTEGFDDPTNGDNEAFAVIWTLGDGTATTGLDVSHRFIRSGPSRVCVVALDRSGRVAFAETTLDVLPRTSLGSFGRAGFVRGFCIALGTLALVMMLLGWIKGNIFQRRRRLSSGMEAR